MTMQHPADALQQEDDLSALREPPRTVSRTPNTVFDVIGRSADYTVLVAEISNAHNGSLDRAHALVEAAAQAGAHAIKFQAYTPQDLVTTRGDGPAPEPWGAQGWTMRNLYEKAQTPLAWFPSLIDHAESLSLPWYASVFGPAGLAAMEVLGCPAYKLSSLEARARNLYSAVVATGKPLVRSIPTQHRPARVLPHETLLYCPPGYPQERVSMRAMRRFDGLSYHGTHVVTAAVAAQFGARMLEVHVQLDAEPSELEANVSLGMRDVRYLADYLAALTQQRRALRQQQGREQQEIDL